ncbi:MAG TPA: serine hydrolase domain-containing protein [Tepidisphaeraceae bacterium]|nr:serine hydrolase domain-containing protein [Tepidisphaeraceae bacterium]
MSELTKTTAHLQRGMAEGLHVGVQLYVCKDHETITDLALGEARTGVAMTPQTLMPWMSCSKPIGAVAIAQLHDRGVLDFDDLVAHHIPEFAVNGKDTITLRHLLTHTAGLRPPSPGWDERPWDEIIAAICATSLQPGWTPGEKAGYSAAAGWFILGEIVRRADGRPYEQYVREAIFQPLGMHDCWIGMPVERYRACEDRIGMMHDTSRTPMSVPNLSQDEREATSCRPGGGGRGPMRELGRLYEMLLARGEDVLSAQSLGQLTARQRIGMFDNTFRHTIDWGLGFIINSNRYGADSVPYGFGKHASEDTFGHGGAQSSASFADPVHGLVVAIVWNGTPGEPKHQRRARETLTALYEDLSLI